MVGTREEYPTESAARKSPVVQAILLRLNAEQPGAAGAADFGAVIARYEQEEMPERYSTKSAYQSYIRNQIRPRWADTQMSAIKPMAVEDWLKNLALAPKTKSHVRSLMHTIFQCAERWELIDKNPIKLVRVKGGTKRLKTPRVLAPDQFHSLLPLIREPYRTMVLIAGCLGLRVSEIVALQWRRFRFSRTHAADSTERGSRQGRGREDRVLAGQRSARPSVGRGPDAAQGAVASRRRKGGCSPIRSQANRITRRRFRRSTSAKLASQPRSAAISAGTRSGTAIGRGWTKPGRLSPSKRS